MEAQSLKEARTFHLVRVDMLEYPPAKKTLTYPAGEVKDMLLKMANQELKHKEKVEYLYSNTAFPQTSGG